MDRREISSLEPGEYVWIWQGDEDNVKISRTKVLRVMSNKVFVTLSGWWIKPRQVFRSKSDARIGYLKWVRRYYLNEANCYKKLIERLEPLEKHHNKLIIKIASLKEDIRELEDA